MLVLKRAVGESFLIGDDIEVMIVSRDGTELKIGIHAPGRVVLRSEVYEHFSGKAYNPPAEMAEIAAKEGR